MPPRTLQIPVAAPPTTTLVALDDVLVRAGVEAYVIVRAVVRCVERARHRLQRYPSEAPTKVPPDKNRRICSLAEGERAHVP